jgi:hypothetical protein
MEQLGRLLGCQLTNFAFFVFLFADYYACKLHYRFRARDCFLQLRCPFVMRTATERSLYRMHYPPNYVYYYYCYYYYYYYYYYYLALQLSAGYGLLVTRGFLITQNDAPQLVGLLLDE